MSILSFLRDCFAWSLLFFLLEDSLFSLLISPFFIADVKGDVNGVSGTVSSATEHQLTQQIDTHEMMKACMVISFILLRLLFRNILLQLRLMTTRSFCETQMFWLTASIVSWRTRLSWHFSYIFQNHVVRHLILLESGAFNVPYIKVGTIKSFIIFIQHNTS